MPLRGTPDHENGALFGYSDGRRFSGPGRNLLGAWSPRVSLTRTALRTRDCCHAAHASTQSRLLDSSLSSGGACPGDTPMDILYPCCAGLDVHKQTVVATV